MSLVARVRRSFRGKGAGSVRIHRYGRDVDVATGLPLAWQIRTTREAGLHAVAPLLDTLSARGLRPQTCAMDAG